MFVLGLAIYKAIDEVIGLVINRVVSTKKEIAISFSGLL